MSPGDRKSHGTRLALLLHSSNTQLPRLLRIHKKVSCGCQLEAADLAFMQEVCQITNSMKSLMDTQPDYHVFLSSYISLIREITGLALANEVGLGTQSSGPLY